MQVEKEIQKLEKFRSAEITRSLVKEISRIIDREFGECQIKIMHVCGSHEHTITYYGLRSLLPESLDLVAGPGCPVCVCSTKEIREAIEIAKSGAILCTFGDMLRDRTPYGSLDDARGEGADVRIVYSPADALKIAKDVQKDVVFFGVGFETSSAPVCSLAYEDAPDNFSILTSLKRTSPAVEALLQAGEIALDGVIAPGHVSTIVGARDWKNLPEKFGIPTIVAGFEPVDMLISIKELLNHIRDGKSEILIEYKRLVSYEGNKKAQEMLAEVFDIKATYWRAMGEVPYSGYYFKNEFKNLDARRRFELRFEIEPDKDTPPGCLCHLIVTGKAYPSDCKLFTNRKCRPDAPCGPCMVSGEGTCYIWYRYGSTQKLRDKLRAKESSGGN
jgi:hydrogenase expression/formation protein HypD